MGDNHNNDNLRDDVRLDVNNITNEKDDVISSGSEEDSLDNVATGERPAWDNKFQYIMAALGFAVGLGNIWRFPYLCHKNGGGAFLIPYFLMLFLEGYPLYYLELAVGQKIRKGSIGVWTSISPKIAGIGFASMVVSLLIGLYYNMILAWALFYLFHSFQSPLPWANCPLDNGTIVAECAKSGPTSYFWYRTTLDISPSIDTGGTVNWQMLVALFVAWLIVFLAIMKGIKSSGKVMYFATAFPYIVLVAFFIRGMTLDGAAEGVAYMFRPDLKRLLDPVVWREAATQIFFSLGLGYGAIIAYSSYNPKNNDCAKDAKFVATANSITSVFACVTVFSILGHKAHNNVIECDQRNRELLTKFFPSFDSMENHTHEALEAIIGSLNETHPDVYINMTDIKSCSIKTELGTIGEGTGLAFIAFAEAIISFPAAPFWSFLFFSMLLCIGMSSEFGILQGFMTTIMDTNFKIHKTVLSASLCLGMFLVGILFTMNSGSYFLDVFDTYSATLALVAIAICETLSVSYIYGIERFLKDIEEMVGSKPGLYWKISWKYTCPIIMIIIFIASVVDLILESPSYQPWLAELGSKVEEKIAYPPWVYLIIVVLVASSLICFPLFYLLHRFNIYTPAKHYLPARDGVIVPQDENGVTESTQPLTSNL